ncbi:transcription factor, contains a PHD finger motif [Clonorchis sinensis]|uniref:Transcription factor, contains a PHD finger motif n=1 Tax=Clonorchis sinensis TaxID=79923 RepID=A0A8T1M4F3_CLOSI|nr:transcription factor, contains a PHD finger motif [Clonorchis sinensis]
MGDLAKVEAVGATDTNAPTKPELLVQQPEQHLSKVITIDVPPGPQCYCLRPRDFSVADFQCSVCYKWFHLDCIAFNIGKSLPFLTAYHFMCKKCNSNGEEVFSRKQANFAVMCQTALANLMWRHGGRLYFSKEKELIPFLEEFWEELTTQPRRSNNSWYPNIHKTLTSSDAFKTVDVGEDLVVCLSNTDIGKMGPSYDRFRALTSQLRTNISKLGLPSALGTSGQGLNDSAEANTASFAADQDGAGDVVGWRKRKSPGSGTAISGQIGATGSSGVYGPSGNGTAAGFSAEHVGSGTGVGLDSSTDFPMRTGTGRLNGTGAPVTSGGLGGSLVRSTRRAGGAPGLCGAAAVGGGPFSGPDEGRAKLNALGFPIDHPLNKEGYRYILVEADKHASGRDLWDECEHTAGKPIPGLFYRVYLSPQVVISLNDRANHLKLHESQLMITGDKGYCMARATHGVHTGTWYFEATITDQPEGAATRIGWSQVLGNLQAPCGYDKFSYSWRSRFGTVFHDSRGRHYADSGYSKDDVIGCMIHLPTNTGNALTSSENKPTKPKEPTGSLDSTESLPVSEALAKVNAVSGQSTNVGSKTRPLMVNQLLETYKDRPLIKFRNSYYFEEKDEPTKAEKALRVLPGSKISFYRNGECQGTAFTDIYAGLYYPAISIYRSATVSVNFGPNFKYPPPRDDADWQPMSDRRESAAVEQTLSDMLYLVEKDGMVERLIKSYEVAP